LLESWAFSPEEALKLGPAVGRFGRELYEEFFRHREAIDQRIDALSQGWPLDRMPVVDRNILRMALTELLYLPDIPVGASIDEAVDLAKEYGTAESGRFVNGILGTVARELQAAGRTDVDPSHAFYLGYEMAKAVTALSLGKDYRQDQALDWGHLTRPEIAHGPSRAAARVAEQAEARAAVPPQPSEAAPAP